VKDLFLKISTYVKPTWDVKNHYLVQSNQYDFYLLSMMQNMVVLCQMIPNERDDNQPKVSTLHLFRNKVFFSDQSLYFTNCVTAFNSYYPTRQRNAQNWSIPVL
jgi:hypothetical protein